METRIAQLTSFAFRILIVASIFFSADATFAIPLKIEPMIVKLEFPAFDSFKVTTSGICDIQEPSEQYAFKSGFGFVYTYNSNIKYLNDPSRNFKEVFFREFPKKDGWDLKPWQTGKLSDNSLMVHTYDALHGKPKPTSVGIEFHIRYEPHGNDPLNNLHWIQVISNNHKWDNLGGKHGVDENKIDNDNPNLFVDSPYYDEVFTADSRNFYDLSSRPDDNREHYWYAELFLVSGPDVTQPGPIIYYGGVEWGWGNYIVPEPSTLLLLGTGLVGIFVFGRKRLFTNC